MFNLKPPFSLVSHLFDFVIYKNERENETEMTFQDLPFAGFAIASNMKHKALVLLLSRNESEVSIYYENTFQTKLSDLIGKNASNFDHFSVVAVDNSTLTITVQSTGFVMEVIWRI